MHNEIAIFFSIQFMRNLQLNQSIQFCSPHANDNHIIASLETVKLNKKKQIEKNKVIKRDVNMLP